MKHPIVLLLEDCPVTGLIVERTILSQLPEVRLLWARSAAEASQRSEGLPVALFLVDVYLPDGSGLDFLWSKAATHPEAKAIVMTSSPLPEHEAVATALNVLQIAQKPVVGARLIEMVRGAIEISSPNDGADSAFHATLKSVTPADLIQLKCLARATTVMEFQSDGRSGRVRIEDGEITDASTEASHGTDAVVEIISWKRGQIFERPAVGTFARTIEQPWHSILMEAAQHADEMALAEPAKA